MAKKLGGTRKRKVVQDANLFETTDTPTERVNLDRDSSGEGPGMDSPGESVIDGREIESCPTCNSLEFWWNYLHQRRCLACDPPKMRSEQLITLAATLRSKAELRRT